MSGPSEDSMMILSLNCAKGESSTYAVLAYILNNPVYHLLLLQEPWLNRNHEPPPARGFDLFIPDPTTSKCAIYVRQSAQLCPTLAFSESNSFLGLQLSTPAYPFTIYNMYSPGRQDGVCHLFHSFIPDSNSIIW